MRRLAAFILIIILTSYLFISLSEAGQDINISNIKLKGTLFTRSFEPLAVIEDTRSGRVTMYKLGDKLEGSLEITQIQRGEVVLRSGQDEYKLLFPMGGVAQPQISSAAGITDYGIKKDGNAILIDRNIILEALSNASDIMKNVEIKPYFASGKRCGVKVTRFTPIGILKEAGVKKGDVIKSINGLKIDTPHQIFSAYKKLKDSQELSVDIIRDNRPVILTYKISG